VLKYEISLTAGDIMLPLCITVNTNIVLSLEFEEVLTKSLTSTPLTLWLLVW